VSQRLPRVPPLPPARVVAGSGGGGGGHGGCPWLWANPTKSFGLRFKGPACVDDLDRSSLNGRSTIDGHGVRSRTDQNLTSLAADVDQPCGAASPSPRSSHTQ
jgi:hypothetical protein